MAHHVRSWDILAAGMLVSGVLGLCDLYARKHIGNFETTQAPAAIEANAPQQTTTIRLRQGEGFQSLAARCGITINDDAIMPSAGSVVYNAFIDALHDLNPRQFTRQNVPLPGPYSVPTELCPGQDEVYR